MASDQRNDRRMFFARVAKGCGAALAGGVVWSGYLLDQKSALLTLRPPGALAESAFQKTCLRCGLCVSACPYETLALATPGAGPTTGMPTFTPREVPCYLCEDIPCAAACPSGALDLTRLTAAGDDDGFVAPAALSVSPAPITPDIKLARMGVAVLDRTNCIAAWGIQCDACYRACPLIDVAIYLEVDRDQRTGKHARMIPVIDAQTCTGCGLCERACVTEKASIFVLPRQVALGRPGSHYVKGWDRADESRINNAAEDVTTTTERSAKSPLDYLNDDDSDDE